MKFQCTVIRRENKEFLVIPVVESSGFAVVSSTIMFDG